MKKICLIFLIFLLGIWGCSNSVGPTDDAEQIQKRSISEQPNWLGFPSRADKSLSKIVSTEKTLDPSEKSEKIEVKGEFEKASGGEFKYKVVAEFKKGCYDHQVDVTMSLDLDTGILTILPHMEFNFPLEIEYLIEGFAEDLEDVALEFVYLNPNGDFEPLECQNIHYKQTTGEINVQQALTSHTSRFTGLTN